MATEDPILRARLATWVASRLDCLGIDEAEAGRMIGRRPGWLARSVERRRPRDELTLSEALRLVADLGGDPDAVLSGLFKHRA